SSPKAEPRTRRQRQQEGQKASARDPPGHGGRQCKLLPEDRQEQPESHPSRAEGDSGGDEAGRRQSSGWCDPRPQGRGLLHELSGVRYIVLTKKKPAKRKIWRVSPVWLRGLTSVLNCCFRPQLNVSIILRTNIRLVRVLLQKI